LTGFYGPPYRVLWRISASMVYAVSTWSRLICLGLCVRSETSSLCGRNVRCSIAREHASWVYLALFTSNFTLLHTTLSHLDFTSPHLVLRHRVAALFTGRPWQFDMSRQNHIRPRTRSVDPRVQRPNDVSNTIRVSRLPAPSVRQ